MKINKLFLLIGILLIPNCFSYEIDKDGYIFSYNKVMENTNRNYTQYGFQLSTGAINISLIKSPIDKINLKDSLEYEFNKLNFNDDIKLKSIEIGNKILVTEQKINKTLKNISYLVFNNDTKKYENKTKIIFITSTYNEKTYKWIWKEISKDDYIYNNNYAIINFNLERKIKIGKFSTDFIPIITIKNATTNTKILMKEYDWFNSSIEFRTCLNITNQNITNNLSKGQTVNFSINHTKLFLENKTLNGNTIWLAYNTTEIDRFNKTIINMSDSSYNISFDFKIQQNLTPKFTNTWYDDQNYCVYYANVTGYSIPLQDGKQIYTFFDHFYNLSDWKEVNNTWGIDSNTYAVNIVDSTIGYLRNKNNFTYYDYIFGGLFATDKNFPDQRGIFLLNGGEEPAWKPPNPAGFKIFAGETTPRIEVYTVATYNSTNYNPNMNEFYLYQFFNPFSGGYEPLAETFYYNNFTKVSYTNIDNITGAENMSFSQFRGLYSVEGINKWDFVYQYDFFKYTTITLLPEENISIPVIPIISPYLSSNIEDNASLFYMNYVISIPLFLYALNTNSYIISFIISIIIFLISYISANSEYIKPILAYVNSTSSINYYSIVKFKYSDYYTVILMIMSIFLFMKSILLGIYKKEENKGEIKHE